MVCWLILAGSGFVQGLNDPPTEARWLRGKLERLEGGKVALAEVGPRPALLELWASWCLPCREQAAIVADLGDDLEEIGVDVFAVNQGEKRKLVEAFLAEHPSHAPVLLDPYQRLASQLGVDELPTLVLVGAEGRVLATAVGLTSRSQLKAMLRSLEEVGEEPAAF